MVRYEELSAAEAKTDLGLVRRALAQVRRREEEIAELEGVLAGCTSKADGLPRGQGGDGLAVQVGRLVELKECLAAEIAVFLDERERVLRRIGLVRNGNMRDVLVYRYVVGLGWEEIAADMHYSVQHVFRLHGWALQAYGAVRSKDESV